MMVGGFAEVCSQSHHTCIYRTFFLICIRNVQHILRLDIEIIIAGAKGYAEHNSNNSYYFEFKFHSSVF